MATSIGVVIGAGVAVLIFHSIFQIAPGPGDDEE